MIHKSSVIDLKAKIGKDIKIGPFCFIGPNVELDDGVELISNVHIEGKTKIGKGTKIYPFASIGTTPQDLKYKGEANSLDIGENNIFNIKSEVKKWLTEKVNIFGLYKHEYYNEKEDFQFKVGFGIKL